MDKNSQLTFMAHRAMCGKLFWRQTPSTVVLMTFHVK